MSEDGKSLYRVFRTDSKGNPLSGWVLRRAKSEEAAMRMVRRATTATIVHPSSYWQEQRALGFYPEPQRRKRRQ